MVTLARQIHIPLHGGTFGSNIGQRRVRISINPANFFQNRFGSQQHDALADRTNLVSHLPGIFAIGKHDERIAGGVEHTAQSQHFSGQFKFFHIVLLGCG